MHVAIRFLKSYCFEIFLKLITSFSTSQEVQLKTCTLINGKYRPTFQQNYTQLTLTNNSNWQSETGDPGVATVHLTISTRSWASEAYIK